MLHQVRAGRRSQGSAAPLPTPLPAVSSVSSFAASFNPMTPDTKLSLRFSCQGPQTPYSRRQPSLPAGPSEAGVHAKRHFVYARGKRSSAICTAVALDRSRWEKALCPLLLLLEFILVV